MKISTVIIEDEKSNVDILTHFINKYCPLLELVGIAGDVEQGVALIDEFKPEITFLDIMLENGSGFDILDRIKESTRIIFVTAYSEFAVKAFKYCALDYLQKPVQIEELKSAVNKALDDLKSAGHLAQLNLLVERLSNENKSTPNDVIAIPMLDRIELLRVEDILYIEADGKYSRFHLRNAKAILSSKNVGQYEENLMGNSDFIRVHNSYVVNLKAIKSINKVEGVSCQMNNGQSIPVSRRKKDDLFDVLRLK